MASATTAGSTRRPTEVATERLLRAALFAGLTSFAPQSSQWCGPPQRLNRGPAGPHRIGRRVPPSPGDRQPGPPSAHIVRGDEVDPGDDDPVLTA